MSLSPIIQPVVRRAILDLLNDVGGPQNHDVIARFLIGLGHRVARRDIEAELTWLAEAGLVSIEALGPFTVAEIGRDGIDVSDGNLRIDGVHRHRTGS